MKLQTKRNTYWGYICRASSCQYAWWIEVGHGVSQLCAQDGELTSELLDRAGFPHLSLEAAEASMTMYENHITGTAQQEYWDSHRKVMLRPTEFVEAFTKYADRQEYLNGSTGSDEAALDVATAELERLIDRFGQKGLSDFLYRARYRLEHGIHEVPLDDLDDDAIPF